MTWFLRSIGDRDTHCGELAADGTVTAACGITFAPRPLPHGRLGLPGHPYDRAQICPACHDGVRSTSTGKAQRQADRTGDAEVVP